MRIALLAAVATACLTIAMPTPATALPPPVPCQGCTAFPPTTDPWQIQFQGKLNFKVKKASVIDIDGFDNSAATVSTLEAGGRKTLCYISAGSWENWRPDQGDFPPELLGNVYDGYPDERWLDIRRMDLLAPILEARIQMCKDKGFDAVDPDNLNGFENDTGFPLTAGDQINFNAWLANLVHSKGLAVGLKNDGPQVGTLVNYYDFAIVESCFQYEECSPYESFVQNGKAVFAIEYKRPKKYCAEAKLLGFSAIYKRPDLKASRITC
jgi:hypothetical protein